MEYKEIIAKVAQDNQLSAVFVDKVYKTYWKAIREYIISLPLKEDLTDEEFLKLRPNVNIPSLGKLNVTLDRYHNMKKHHIKLMNLSKKNKQDSNVKD